MGKEPHINGYAPEWPLRLGGNAQNQDLINLHQLVPTWERDYEICNTWFTGCLLLNFIKHNRKLMNKGEMKVERIEKFKELLAKIEECKRVNQWT